MIVVTSVCVLLPSSVSAKASVGSIVAVSVTSGGVTPTLTVKFTVITVSPPPGRSPEQSSGPAGPPVQLKPLEPSAPTNVRPAAGSVIAT